MMLEVPHGKQIHNFRAHGASAGFSDGDSRRAFRPGTTVAAGGHSERRTDSGPADRSGLTAAADTNTRARQHPSGPDAGTARAGRAEHAAGLSQRLAVPDAAADDGANRARK